MSPWQAAPSPSHVALSEPDTIPVCPEDPVLDEAGLDAAGWLAWVVGAGWAGAEFTGT